MLAVFESLSKVQAQFAVCRQYSGQLIKMLKCKWANAFPNVCGFSPGSPAEPDPLGSEFSMAAWNCLQNNTLMKAESVSLSNTL